MSWPVASVGEVCEVVSGATPKTGKAEFWEGDVPWVTPKDLSELRQKHLSDTPRKITRAGLKSCSARMLPAQSVLFSSRAPIGLVAINTLPVCTNQGFKSLVPRFDLVSPDFLFWWLKAQEKHIQSKGRGATFKEVSKKIVEDLQMPLPPLAEQRRIAGVLDAADALRAKRREALAQFDTLLQSTFLDMFGDPVTNPMGWTKVRSGELFLLPPKIGTITPAAGRGYLVVRVGEVGESRIAFERCGRVEISEKDFAKFRLERGDTVIARAIGSKNHLGKASFFADFDEATVIDSHVMRFRPDPIKCDGLWFYSLISSDRGKVLLQQTGGATAVQFNINAKQAASLQVALPPLNLQRHFAAIAESVERQKASQRTHLAELDTLFASLQSRAFRGEL